MHGMAVVSAATAESEQHGSDGEAPRGGLHTLPGVMSPSPSADSIMLRPILSLTLEHGSMDSSFAATRALLPFVTWLRYTSGVFPVVRQQLG